MENVCGYDEDMITLLRDEKWVGPTQELRKARQTHPDNVETVHTDHKYSWETTKELYDKTIQYGIGTVLLIYDDAKNVDTGHTEYTYWLGVIIAYHQEEMFHMVRLTNGKLWLIKLKTMKRVIIVTPSRFGLVPDTISLGPEFEQRMMDSLRLILTPKVYSLFVAIAMASNCKWMNLVQSLLDHGDDNRCKYPVLFHTVEDPVTKKVYRERSLWVQSLSETIKSELMCECRDRLEQRHLVSKNGRMDYEYTYCDPQADIVRIKDQLPTLMTLYQVVDIMALPWEEVSLETRHMLEQTGVIDGKWRAKLANAFERVDPMKWIDVVKNVFGVSWDTRTEDDKKEEEITKETISNEGWADVCDESDSDSESDEQEWLDGIVEDGSPAPYTVRLREHPESVLIIAERDHIRFSPDFYRKGMIIEIYQNRSWVKAKVLSFHEGSLTACLDTGKVVSKKKQYAPEVIALNIMEDKVRLAEGENLVYLRGDRVDVVFEGEDYIDDELIAADKHERRETRKFLVQQYINMVGTDPGPTTTIENPIDEFRKWTTDIPTEELDRMRMIIDQRRRMCIPRPATLRSIISGVLLIDGTRYDLRLFNEDACTYHPVPDDGIVYNIPADRVKPIDDGKRIKKKTAVNVLDADGNWQNGVVLKVTSHGTFDVATESANIGYCIHYYDMLCNKIRIFLNLDDVDDDGSRIEDDEDDDMNLSTDDNSDIEDYFNKTNRTFIAGGDSIPFGE